MTTNDGCRADVRKARAEAARPDPTAAAVRAAQAEALREAAEEIVWRGMQSQGDWLRDRAARLATDTAAPEGAFFVSAGVESALTEAARTGRDINIAGALYRKVNHGLPAAPVAVEGVETVEWGVEWPNGAITSTGWMPGVSEQFARNAMEPRRDRIEASPPPVRVVNRTRVSYPDRVSEWSPVEPETSEPEGDIWEQGARAAQRRDWEREQIADASEPEGGELR